MKFTTSTLDGEVQCIALDGRLDIDGTRAIDERFSFITTGRKDRIVVDLSGVSFLASIGIRLLMTAARGQKGRGGRFVLAAPQSVVRDVLETAGIDQLIPLHADVESARAAASAPHDAQQ
jgi:anti-sigma B factor antagonist